MARRDARPADACVAWRAVRTFRQGSVLPGSHPAVALHPQLWTGGAGLSDAELWQRRQALLVTVSQPGARPAPAVSSDGVPIRVATPITNPLVRRFADHFRPATAGDVSRT